MDTSVHLVHHGTRGYRWSTMGARLVGCVAAAGSERRERAGFEFLAVVKEEVAALMAERARAQADFTGDGIDDWLAYGFDTVLFARTNALNHGYGAMRTGPLKQIFHGTFVEVPTRRQRKARPAQFCARNAQDEWMCYKLERNGKAGKMDNAEDWSPVPLTEEAMNLDLGERLVVGRFLPNYAMDQVFDIESNVLWALDTTTLRWKRRSGPKSLVKDLVAHGAIMYAGDVLGTGADQVRAHARARMT
jgi:hypothetical protein